MVAFSDLRTIARTGNAHIDGLTADYAFRDGYTIGYVFDPGPAGGVNGGARWAQAGAASAFNLAMALWAEVADISYELLASYSGYPGGYTWVEEIGAIHDGNTIAYHYLPGTGDLGGRFDNTVGSFTSASNLPGGFGFAVFLHEIGHGLGLDHPHEGRKFPGVVVDSDLGDHDLNQGVFTIMSYNDGYVTEKGRSSTDNYGFQASPMALDIAAVQAIYGPNTATRTGGNVYELPDANQSRTGYRSIWDAGGTDTIVYSGSEDATIDLRGATLRAEEGGGGFLSSAANILGGFTIANGVIIENGTGGGGFDTIRGNDADNLLTGNQGWDLLLGGAGDDTLNGGADEDHLQGQEGNDLLDGGNGRDVLEGGADRDTIFGGDGADEVEGADGDDAIHGGDGDDRIVDGAGDDLLRGGEGNDYIFASDGSDSLYGDAGDDTLVAGPDSVLMDGGTGDDVYQLDGEALPLIEGANAGFDTVYIYGWSYVLPEHVEALYNSSDADGLALSGNHADNTIQGGSGDETISGGLGADVLIGEGGVDRFSYTIFAESTPLSRDTIRAFEHGIDLIDLLALGSVEVSIAAVAGGQVVFADGVDERLELFVTGLSPVTLSDLVYHTNAAPDAIDLPSQAISENAAEGTLVGVVSAADPDGEALRYAIIGDSSGIFSVDSETGTILVARGGFLDFEFASSIAITVRATDGAGLFIERAFVVSITDVAESNQLLGTSAPDRLTRPFDDSAGYAYYGRDGNDTISARLGDDTMVGGEGDETYFVRNAGDVILERGGEGYDDVRVYINGYTLAENVDELRLLGSQAHVGYGNAGDNKLVGDGGGDTLEGRGGDDRLNGEAAADLLIGGDGVDELLGMDGQDTLEGGSSDDRLLGHLGKDIILGGDGDDTMIGGGNRDTLEGGAGADRFGMADGEFEGGTFADADWILDFNRAEGDLIDLRRVDAVIGGDDDAFAFIGTAAFTGAAGELRYEILGSGRTLITGDLDGDGVSDIAIRLEQVIALQASDFMV